MLTLKITVYSDEIYPLNHVDYTVYPQYFFSIKARNEYILLRVAKDISA